MSLLAIKLSVTPLMILAASLAGRRWGEMVGGWLVGLPLTSGPVAVFLALEQGPDFAVQASAGSLAGVAAQAGFAVAYARLARRGWGLALAGGAAAFWASAGVLQLGRFDHSALFLVAVACLVLALRALPRNSPARVRAKMPWWDIPARMAVVTLLIVALTSLAATLGPRLSGVLPTFPLFGATLAVFAHRTRGPAAATDVLRGMAASLFGFAVFFYVLGFVLAKAGIPAAFAAATVGSLVVQAAALMVVRRPAVKAA
jgi:uncharacterized membrane protein (GlpM family)